ncbi:dUTP diphosphatase [Brevibacillus sp. MER 51]|uniref:dUTP diphosphatase n=1 Tax=Brevibacillus sp. MER 51 TaxID=2939560 RepID=UPI00203F7573|nr:dUTP diphosphatase [Brevibacillus sp. MER 51]MCM3144348.1 dUTP diphosphatase [Brevibacillus sp. MER 51]
MNLTPLFEKQQQLDQYIVKKKGLEGQDLLPNKILALRVELGELANEWRGFKHWSNNQEPRYERKCHACKGRGKFAQVDACGYCGGTGVEAKPLLEEYIDCLHFILSIGNDLNITDEWVTDIDLSEPDYTDVTSQLNHIFGLIDTDMDAHDWFGIAEQFISLGSLFGFSWEQIEQAYSEKWDENFRRQNVGY